MSEPKTVMSCGHAANATDGSGRPVCVICLGIVNGAEVPDPEPPSLEGRTSRCTYCRSEVPSDYALPFFKRSPGDGPDSHYDGCRGWD